MLRRSCGDKHDASLTGGLSAIDTAEPRSNDAQPQQQSEGKPRKQRKAYQAVQVPTPEQIMQEDFMNNCAVRTGLSGVMGLGLGAMFGIAIGTFDTAVSIPSHKSCSKFVCYHTSRPTCRHSCFPGRWLGWKPRGHKADDAASVKGDASKHVLQELVSKARLRQPHYLHNFVCHSIQLFKIARKPKRCVW